VTDAGRRRSGTGRRWLVVLGVLLVVLGLASIAWGVATWRWGDPLTAVYTAREQNELESELEQKRKAFLRTAAPELPALTTVSERRGATRPVARRYRAGLTPGSATGRLLIPRLGLDVVVVYGTDSAVLRRGPGIHERTAIPGQGELVYIAGHRTTYGAPFAHIDRLRPGDQATMEMPYGRYVYRVTGHRIVDDNDLSVLRSHGREELSLQACHPRFRATQRYIVAARLARFVPATGPRA
jgi:sortase A